MLQITTLLIKTPRLARAFQSAAPSLATSSTVVVCPAETAHSQETFAFLNLR